MPSNGSSDAILVDLHCARGEAPEAHARGSIGRRVIRRRVIGFIHTASARRNRSVRFLDNDAPSTARMVDGRVFQQWNAPQTNGNAHDVAPYCKR